MDKYRGDWNIKHTFLTNQKNRPFGSFARIINGLGGVFVKTERNNEAKNVKTERNGGISALLEALGI